MNLSATFIVPDNAFLDALRLAVVIGSLICFAILVKTFQRRPSYLLAGACIFVFLTAVGEAQQIGEPFLVFQLPLRVIGIFFFIRGYFLGETRTHVVKDY